MGSRRQSKNLGDEARYRVRGIRRDPVDIAKLSRALIGLVLADLERAAQADHAATSDRPKAREDVDPGGGTDD